MKKETIVRAWKDPVFRASLSPEERESLPESPSGESMSALNETELHDVVGGIHIYRTCNWYCETIAMPFSLDACCF